MKSWGKIPYRCDPWCEVYRNRSGARTIRPTRGMNKNTLKSCQELIQKMIQIPLWIQTSFVDWYYLFICWFDTTLAVVHDPQTDLSGKGKTMSGIQGCGDNSVCLHFGSGSPAIAILKHVIEQENTNRNRPNPGIFSVTAPFFYRVVVRWCWNFR